MCEKMIGVSEKHIVANMREIFKRQCGKDFYRDGLEYFEYNEEDFYVDNESDMYVMDDDEISYYISKKFG